MKGNRNKAKIRFGAVVSDLHMLTNRTTVHDHMADIRKAADECDLFVFNGDIFDFQWSVYHGFEDSVLAAEKWIRDLVAAHPGTRFVFLLGNHDSVSAYQDALDRMKKELPNLEWHPVWYIHGKKLFLHGDLSLGRTSGEKLLQYRRRRNKKLGRSRFRHAFYHAFTGTGLHPMFLRFINRKTCARRILAFLSREMKTELADIREIYFGHVHTPFKDFQYRGVIFHNTGAAVRRLRLSVIRFEL